MDNENLLDQVYGADESQSEVRMGYAIKVTGEPRESMETAGEELGELIGTDGFLFGYIDPRTCRTVAFIWHGPDDPDPTAERMQRVPFLLGTH